MKKLAILVFLFSAKLLAIPMHDYTCSDPSGQWQVKASIALHRQSQIGSLTAFFQGWKVISVNIDKEVTLHVGTEFVSNTGVVLRNSVFDGSTLIIPGHETVALSCQQEYKDEPPQTCLAKHCGHDGPVWYQMEVGPGYQCVQVNIMCKT